MKQKHLFLLLLLLLLAACSSNTATVDPATVDVASLPADIDVQTVNAIKDRDDVFVIDVREQWEYDEGHIPNITLMPMGEIASRLSEIPTDKEVVVTCRSGNRSSQVATFLRDQGFTNVHNMEGGILAWQQAGLPVE
ncbi:MAG: rhodanese-like domain-containing protein [Ardenticatenaceae bacterium]|nr:rhodanese-like domain-containing protein [Ardenticatenaceae bacterium]